MFSRIFNRSASAPISVAGVKTQLLPAGSAVDADNDWLSAGIVSLDSGAWRRLRLLLDCDPGAAGSQVGLLVLGSFSNTVPATGITDDWFALGATDGSWTSTTLNAGGAFPASTAFTLAPNWFTSVVRGTVLLSPPALNAADDIRIAFPAIDIAGVRHFQVLYSQQDAGAALTLGLWYVLSV